MAKLSEAQEEMLRMLGRRGRSLVATSDRRRPYRTIRILSQLGLIETEQTTEYVPVVRTTAQLTELGRKYLEGEA